MAWMYGNDKIPSRNFGDSSQLTNWILDSGATCHMMPQVSDFIPGSLEDRDNHIEVADGHCIVVKQIAGQYPYLIMIMTKRNMHLWHICLIMTKVLVDILVTVCN